MRSRDARGNSGGGFDVSSGGSGGKGCGGAGVIGAIGGAGAGSGGCVIMPGAPGCFCAGFGLAGLTVSFLTSSGVCDDGFGLAGVARAAGGGDGCCAAAGASVRTNAPARSHAAHPANPLLANDGRSPAAIILSFLRKRNGRALCL